MIFRLLGPLDVRSGGRAVAIGGTKARLLLAHLLLHANRLVPAEQLAAVLWPAGPPPSAAANLQTYVWKLRKALPPASGAEPRLATHGTGYTLRVRPHESDLGVVGLLVAGAREDADPAAALATLGRAEAWWRGDPLEDLPAVPAWGPDLARITEGRLAAVEERLALQVRLGEHDAAVAELRVLLAETPYRERLWELLMLALERGGRRADALAVYADARERLVTELGVEPGEGLRAAQLAILGGDPPPAEPVVDAGVWAEPAFPLCQLPPGAPDFTGRTEQIAELRTVLRGRDAASAPAVTVVVGSPGTGKTTLAVHVAHLLRGEFDDGQLYVDLTGTTDTPRDPAAVLGDFLHALGVTGAALPAGVAARTALFRSRLADRRMLVVLDDAASGSQVQALLPASGRCAVLVTSRRFLPELPGAHQLELPAFGAREAGELLARIAGAERVAAEPEEAAAIVRSCGYVPLAIRIAGARLAGRKAWTLRVLHDRLADGSRRLNELRIGELGVRSSFELSLRQLPPPAVRAFGLFALLGAQEFPGWVVQALLDTPDADEALDALVDANLVALRGTDVNGQPRYRVHELLRDYAAEVLDGELPAARRRAALGRALSGWRHLAGMAAEGLPMAFGAFAGTCPSSWRLPEPVAARLLASPLRWFAAERRSLTTAVDLAVDAGFDELAWQLTAVCVPFFDLRSHYEDWQVGHERALGAVRETGNGLGEATLLRGLGQVHLYRDEYAEARSRMAAARAGYAGLGERRGEGYALAGLGTVARVRDQPAQALRHYQASFAALVDVGDRGGEAQLRSSIGMAHAQLGDSAAAADWLGRALALARELADPHREAKVLTELGGLHGVAGRVGEALDCLGQAVAILQDLRDERCTAYALLGIGRVMIAAGEPSYASGPARRALEVFRRTGNRRGAESGLALLEQAGEVTPVAAPAPRTAPPA
ncbi:SARP family transcriptional regulator [Amycolatopsis antarctica]|uniref:SARP family transcriptional regulator n=1 Tax=Amycolatopsis antarctica TaxID=1854586 RepID=A0A263D2Z0_9PSEU|nr:SARP family transcriptional regulator [Amycolatopsis antarctica]